jgi:DNA-binding NarL/FixJ family response regulator
MAAELNPDVILLDFQMPELNGLIAAGRILRANPQMPIVFYTLHQNHFIEAQALALGVRKVISKGDVITSLISSIEEVLNPAAKPTGPLRIREDALAPPDGPDPRPEPNPQKPNGAQKH